MIVGPEVAIQDMHDWMVKPLPPGCRLTAIFDVSTHLERQVCLLVERVFTVLSFGFCSGY